MVEKFRVAGEELELDMFGDKPGVQLTYRATPFPELPVGLSIAWQSLVGDEAGEATSEFTQEVREWVLTWVDETMTHAIWRVATTTLARPLSVAYQGNESDGTWVIIPGAPREYLRSLCREVETLCINCEQPYALHTGGVRCLYDFTRWRPRFERQLEELRGYVRFSAGVKELLEPAKIQQLILNNWREKIEQLLEEHRLLSHGKGG